jgi:hypothetical protein
MTAVLDRLDIDDLEKEVFEFEQLNGEVLSDGEVPDAYNCGGNCFGCCTEKVRASGATGIAKAFAMARLR